MFFSPVHNKNGTLAFTVNTLKRLCLMENLPAIFMDLAVILVAAGVITVVFKWLKQPLVLGYILAGFFIGPYFPWFPAITDAANIHVWSDIGLCS